jgi:hypothetical protein
MIENAACVQQVKDSEIQLALLYPSGPSKSYTYDTDRYFGSQLQNSLQKRIQKLQQVVHMLSLLMDHDAPLRYKTQALLTTYNYHYGNTSDLKMKTSF